MPASWTGILGHQVYDENKEILRSLRMSFLLPNGIVGSHNTFITTTGINFSPQHI